MQTFVHTRPEIQAVQLDVRHFSDPGAAAADLPEGVRLDPTQDIAIVRTKRGHDLRIHIGDWIMRLSDGDLYGCDNAVFRRDYLPAPR